MNIDKYWTIYLIRYLALKPHTRNFSHLALTIVPVAAFRLLREVVIFFFRVKQHKTKTTAECCLHFATEDMLPFIQFSYTE